MPLLGFSQRFVVSNLRENIIYVDVPNTLNFAVEGRLCKDILLSTDNGKIEVTQDSSNYIIYPEKVGYTEVILCDKKSKKHRVIGKYGFRTKYLPNPIVLLAGKSGGEIRKNILKVLPGITVALPTFDFDIKYAIEQYTVIIFRDNKTIYSHECESAIFSDALKSSFNTIEINDKIVFLNISCKLANNKRISLSPAEFKIVD